MEYSLQISPIGIIHNDFSEKFGVPRQSGLVPMVSHIEFLKEYSLPQAFRSLEEFSHLWLIWGFSLCPREQWHPTVRPPKLGGNKRMGVFATRSPFRPNPLGLSSVRRGELHFNEEGRAVLEVLGADLADGTPIYDIKPYLPYTDSHPDALSGWADPARHPLLEVVFEEGALNGLPEEKREACIAVLRQDPRPAYQDDPHREYTMSFGGKEITFCVDGGVLRVKRVC